MIIFEFSLALTGNIPLALLVSSVSVRVPLGSMIMILFLTPAMGLPVILSTF